MFDTTLNESINRKNLYKCLACNNGLVPEFMVCTVDPPQGWQMIGKPEYIQVSALRPRPSMYLKLDKQTKDISE